MGRLLLRALIANGMVRLPERALMHAPNRRLLSVQSGTQRLLDSPIAVASGHSSTPTLAVAPTMTELLFVDSRVRDLNGLLSELFIQQHDGRAIEVVVLDAQRDGMEQITATLALRSEIQTLHLIGQELDQGLQLGQSELGWQSLLRNVGQLSQWQTAFRADGELWFYGTGWNSSSSGRDLLEAIRDLIGIPRVLATRELCDILGRGRSVGCHFEDSNAVYSHRNELVIVDASLMPHPLIAELRTAKTDDEQIHLAELDSARDGLAQITQLLSSCSNLDAVTVLSQAKERAFRFGNLWLHLGNLRHHATTIRGWRSAFAADAELLLIGQADRSATLGCEWLDTLASLLGIEVVACFDHEPAGALGDSSIGSLL